MDFKLHTVSKLTKFIKLGLVLFLFGTSYSQAFPIQHNGALYNGNESNFSLVEPIWNSEGDARFNESVQTRSLQYLFVQEISRTGTLQVRSMLASDSTVVKLYKVIER